MFFNTNTFQTDEMTVRLVGGTSKYMGTVEVTYRNHRGIICDDNWSLANADVVCRMAGFR